MAPRTSQSNPDEMRSDGANPASAVDSPDSTSSDFNLLREIPAIWARAENRAEALESAKRILEQLMTSTAIKAGIRRETINDSTWAREVASLQLSWRYDEFVEGKRNDEETARDIEFFLGFFVDRLFRGQTYLESLRKRAKIPFNLFNKLTRAFREELERRGVRSDVAIDRAQVIADDFVRAHPKADFRTLDFDLAAGIVGATYVATRELPSGAFTTAASASPPLWVDRKLGEFATAESFLLRHYEGRLGIDGDLTQAALGRLDPRLLAALDAEFTGDRRAELRELLPTKKQRNDAVFMREYGYVPTGQDRKTKTTLLARKKPILG